VTLTSTTHTITAVAGRPDGRSGAAVYAELKRAIVAAGLLERAYGDYLVRGGVVYAAFVLSLALPFVLPATPAWSAAEALLIGFASIQVALIGHDAGHLAVVASTRGNRRLGSLCWSLSTGIGFWYWSTRHNAHHAHVNDTGKDPEIQGAALVAFTEHDAASRRGWRRVVVRYQALLSPFMVVFVLLVVVAFRVESWLFALRRLRGARRLGEIALLGANIILWGWAIAASGRHLAEVFLGAQAVAGLYLAAIVAPNHKGMPVWTEDSAPSFLERQVLGSRNVRPHPLTDLLFGGLNYQIEHHLFPTMPRANLARARAIVRPFCRAHGLDYDEAGLLTSYRRVLSELARVGRAAGRHGPSGIDLR
jgi:fatty acid desaturase